MTPANQRQLLQRRLSVHATGLAILLAVAALVWQARSLLRAECAALEEEHLATLAYLKHAGPIEAKHGRLASAVRSLKENVPANLRFGSGLPNDAEFLAQMSQLTRDTNLTMKNFAPSQPTPNGLEVQVTVTGSFSGVCRFLETLEGVPFLYELTQCTLSAPRQTGDPCSLDLRISLLNPAYVLPQFAAAATSQ